MDTHPVHSVDDEEFTKVIEELERGNKEAAGYVVAPEVHQWMKEYVRKMADKSLPFEEWERLQGDFLQRKTKNPEYQFEFFRQTGGSDPAIQKEMQTIAFGLLRKKR